MPQFYYDLLFCAIFIAVLLTIMGKKNSAFGNDRDAYHKILLGLIFLTGFSVVQLWGNQDWFSGMPYLSDPLNRKIVEAIGIVGGLIFLLIGVGSWLPSIFRAGTNKNNFNKRYHALKMINQSLSGSSDFDTALRMTAECLTSYLDFSRCAAMKYSARQDCLHLSHASGFNGSEPVGLLQIPLVDTDLKKCFENMLATSYSGHDPVFESGRKPEYIVPISIGKRNYGALLCWIESDKIDEEMRDFLTTVGTILGASATQRISHKKQEHLNQQNETSSQMTDICNRSSDMQQAIPGLYKLLQESLEVEFLSVAVLDNTGENMIRYSIGASGRMLLEKGVSRCTRGTEVEAIFRSAQPMIEAKVDMENDLNDGLFISCGMKARMIAPVMAGQKVMAVLTVGNSQPGFFSPLALERLNSLSDMLASVIQRGKLARITEEREDQMLRLQLMEREMPSIQSVSGFFQLAGEMLTQRLSCTIARISLINGSQNSLLSQNCQTIRETGYQLNQAKSIPLSILPWHKMTLETDKPMLINQDDLDSQMTDGESSATLLPGIKSAMLVPIAHEGNVRGIISIGESRNWNRRSFGATDLVFARDVAAKCSNVLKLKQVELDRDHFREQWQEKAVTGDDSSVGRWRNQMNTPLSSIIGAAEILKSKSPEDNFSIKYHDMILNAANRIKSVAEEMSGQSNLSETEVIESEMMLG